MSESCRNPYAQGVGQAGDATGGLSVVIVNWNTHDMLYTCLSSLAESTQEVSGEVELIVVDNASTDGSVAMVRKQFPWVTLLVNETNVGFARANNQAIRRSNGRYILLLNSDTKVLPGALRALQAFVEQHDRAGAAGACLLNFDGSLQPSTQPMLTPEREFWRLSFLDLVVRKATYRMQAWDRQTPRKVEVLKGACILLRREALNRVGLLDEAYFMYTEEVDLCYRLAQAGWQLWWVPQAQVIHYGEASSQQAAQEMYIALYRSKVQFYRKFGGESRAERFKRLVRLVYWPRNIVGTLLARTSPTMRARAQTYQRLLAEITEM